MNIRAFTNSIMIAVTIGTWGVDIALSQEFTVVFPPQYADAEAPETDRRSSVTWSDGARVQWALPAEAFMSVPETHRWLSELRQRPDSGTSSPRTMTVDMRFAISTTTTDPSNLSFSFEDNIGDDEMVVFDGEITRSTQNIGPPEGPREFDLVWNLDEPFYYDPNLGNLLIDWTLPPGTTWNIFADSYYSPPGGAVFNTNSSSPIATDFADGSARSCRRPVKSQRLLRCRRQSPNRDAALEALRRQNDSQIHVSSCRMKTKRAVHRPKTLEIS